VVTDSENRAVIGATGLHIWAREERTEGKAEKKKRHSERKPLEEKESYRGAVRAVAARERLSGMSVVTVVQDREGDIYESYAILKEHGVNSRIGRTTTGRSGRDKEVPARKEKTPG
jgi:hypothetical protein